jgi:anaerobic ribonucleoside-triphosphate reductase activating protein
VTISGGEPFEQLDGLMALLLRLQPIRACGTALLVFTGLSESVLRRRHPKALGLVDAVVAGPYARSQPSEHGLLGSANQRLLLLSDLARSRYSSSPDPPELQIASTEHGLTIVGIPRGGDLDRLAAALRDRGHPVSAGSWLG